MSANQKQQDRQIEVLFEHARIANEEMGVIKNDIAWMKTIVKKLDDRTWWILGSIIVGFVTSLYFK